MRDDFVKDERGSALQRMQDSPGRALAIAIVASVLCLGMVALFVFDVRPAITPLVVFTVVMGLAALMNWARFGYLMAHRRK